MKERPILFSGPMVRALLDGFKTQTRREAKRNAAGRVQLGKKQWHVDDPNAILACPYGQPGDRLWVRETFARVHDGLLQNLDPEPDDGTEFNNGWSTVYRANGEPANWQHYGQKWMPSIFMRRAFSRITLEITAVRLEWLQEISRDDAAAEGVDWKECPATESSESIVRGWGVRKVDYIGGYRKLWEKLNGAESWAKNPLVWVVSFKRITA